MKPLDPLRLERAVKYLALDRARRRVLDQIRAEGRKVGEYSCREINELRDQYFAGHLEELITKAFSDVWRLPMFAKYRPQP